ncbi:MULTISPECIES: MFS transporter [Streptomyces]|uniref:MFS transporter n=2 Tax=Streptomyces ardesiacus TaxID=285564 RepID=A0ABW8H8V5_9ACTN|nr:MULTISPECIES: MFS transporter [Streptomyces]KOX29867.1 transporter [Streptomyces sp. NRRL F-4707]MCL7370381.1 MFS transporter [Streptomyces ardesiacus]NEB59686.1 MFS transporter [Streptomyces diastaticus]
MSHTTTDEPVRQASGATVPVLAFAGIVVAVMQTLLVPVIKDLPRLLDTSPSNATWVLTSTLLSGAVATPIMGRLGDLFGKRRMLIASLSVMVFGALLSALTDALVPMIVGRTLQGFAMGAIPLGIGLMRDMLPRERLASAMALMSSSIGVGGGLALPAAALVAQHTDWHVLYFGAAGLGALSIALTLLVVPESPLRAKGSFDLPGALGLSAGLILFLLPISKGSDWGWSSPTTLGLFAAAVVVLLLWGLMELRVAAPLVDLRTTARREVLLTNLASIMVGVSFFVISLVLPQLLQLPAETGYGLGRSMVVAGLCVAPLGLTMMFTAPVYARLSARYGPRTTLIVGLVVIGIGYAGGLGLMSAAWQTVVTSVLIGAGIGLAYSSLPALIIGAVPASETGAANGLNTLMRSIGTSVSSAVIGMVLANTSTDVGGVAVPTMHGFRVSFLIAAAAVAVGLVLAFFLPRRSPAGVSQLRASSEEDANLARAEQALAGAVRPPHGFRGRVLAADGTPVPRAKVTLIDRHGRQAGATLSAEDGGYALAVPARGPYVLAARAAGHAPLAHAATHDGDRPVDLDLSLPGETVPA